MFIGQNTEVKRISGVYWITDLGSGLKKMVAKFETTRGDDWWFLITEDGGYSHSHDMRQLINTYGNKMEPTMPNAKEFYFAELSKEQNVVDNF